MTRHRPQRTLGNIATFLSALAMLAVACGSAENAASNTATTKQPTSTTLPATTTTSTTVPPTTTTTTQPATTAPTSTTAPPTTSTTTTTTTTVPDGDCYDGLELDPGDRCTYPGSTDDFWIDDSGSGHFMFFTAGGGMDIRDSTFNGVKFTLVASRQSDNTWLIEAVG